MLTTADEGELLRRLLKKKSPDKLSASELSNKAHWRWNKGEHLEAAILFDAATVRSAEEFLHASPPVGRNNTFNYRVRAGVNFRLAGEVERAWPILVEATTFDWSGAGILEDSHFTEWAFVEMLQVVAAKQDVRAFSELFWQAVARCDQLGYSFPMIHPKQELLLDLCELLGLEMELRRVISRIEARGKMSRPLTHRIAKAKATISAMESEPRT